MKKQMPGNRVVYCAHRPWNLRRFEDVRRLVPGEWNLVSKKSDLTIERLMAWKPSKVFFLDWSWMVPHEIVSGFECIGFHPTDLPFGRGGSPYQNLILKKKYKSVLSAFRLTDEVDAGPVYLKKPIELSGRAEEFFERISFVTVEMIKEIVEGQIEPVSQKGRIAKFRRRQGKDNHIPRHLKDLDSFYDFVRMLDAPTYPQSYVDHGRFRLYFGRAEHRGTEVTVSVRVVLRDH